jgi:hypothetical protein
MPSKDKPAKQKAAVYVDPFFTALSHSNPVGLGRWASGRGGCGNIHKTKSSASKKPLVDPDLIRQPKLLEVETARDRVSLAGSYHVMPCTQQYCRPLQEVVVEQEMYSIML